MCLDRMWSWKEMPTIYSQKLMEPTLAQNLIPSLGAALWVFLNGGQSQQAPVCFYSSLGKSVFKTALLSFSFPRLEGYN